MCQVLLIIQNYHKKFEYFVKIQYQVKLLSKFDNMKMTELAELNLDLNDCFNFAQGIYIF
jgi:hypothetical protein